MKKYFYCILSSILTLGSHTSLHASLQNQASAPTVSSNTRKPPTDLQHHELIQYLDTIDWASLCKETQTFLNSIKKIEKQSNHVILFGKVGAGKSTTTNYFLGHELGRQQLTHETKEESSDSEAEEEENTPEEDPNAPIVVQKPIPSCRVAPIGHSTANRETEFPELYLKYPLLNIVIGYVRNLLNTDHYARRNQSLYQSCPAVFTCITAFLPARIEGYFDTPGFHDGITPLKTCILNNLLLHSPTNKRIALFFNYGELELARGKTFLEDLREFMDKLVVKEYLYQGNQFNSQAIEELFDSLFFIFTKVNPQGTRKQLIRKKYLEEFEKTYRNSSVPFAQQYTTLVQAMLKKKNYYILRPLDNGKSKKKIEDDFLSRQGIPSDKFSFIGSSDEKTSLITLIEQAQQKTIKNTNAIKLYMHNWIDTIKKIKRETKQNIEEKQRKLSNYIKDKDNEEKVLQQAREDVDKELIHLKQEYDKQNEVVKKSKNNWEEKKKELQRLRPDEAEWDHRLTKNSKFMSQLLTMAFACGVGAVAGAVTIDGVLAGGAAAMGGTVGWSLLVAGSVVGVTAGVIFGGKVYEKFNNFSWTNKKDTPNDNTAIPLDVKVNSPIVSYKIILKPDNILSYEEDSSHSLAQGEIHLLLTINNRKRLSSLLQNSSLKFMLMIKRLRRYKPAYRSRIKRLEEEVKATKDIYQTDLRRLQNNEDMVNRAKMKLSKIDNKKMDVLELIEKTTQNIAERIRYINQELKKDRVAYKTKTVNALKEMNAVVDNPKHELAYLLAKSLPETILYNRKELGEGCGHQHFSYYYEEYLKNRSSWYTLLKSDFYHYYPTTPHIQKMIQKCTFFSKLYEGLCQTGLDNLSVQHFRHWLVKNAMDEDAFLMDMDEQNESNICAYSSTLYESVQIFLYTSDVSLSKPQNIQKTHPDQDDEKTE